MEPVSWMIRGRRLSWRNQIPVPSPFSNLLDGLAELQTVNSIHRRLYCLGPKYHRRNPDPLGENQRVHGPNCISLENALSIFLNFPIWFY